MAFLLFSLFRGTHNSSTNLENMGEHTKNKSSGRQRQLLGGINFEKCEGYRQVLTYFIGFVAALSQLRSSFDKSSRNVV